MWDKEKIQKITKNCSKRGEVLAELIKKFDKKDLIIAEVGVWDSKNAKYILKNCNDFIIQYWGIDVWCYSNHPAYKNITPEKWDVLYFRACKLMRYFLQTHILRMDSIEAAKIFPEQYFDLVFIDADHKHNAVMEDISNWFPLIKNGGLLTGHDYGGKKIGVKQAVDGCFDDVEILDAGVWVTRK